MKPLYLTIATWESDRTSKMDQDPPTTVTLRDLAEALGLSRGAVSRALRNDPRISTGTRERAHAMAAKMGYQPNPTATQLAHYRRGSKTIPVRAALGWLNVWPDPKRMRKFAEFDLYWKGAFSSAEKHGYRLEEFVSNESMPLSRLEDILIARGINGILIPPIGGRSSMDWAKFNWARFSTVMLSRIEVPPCHIVAPDQLWNTMLAFNKMRELGYRRIGFAGWQTPARLFGAGFVWAQLSDGSLKKDELLPPLLWSTSEPLAGQQKKFEQWLRRTKPDAILTERPELPEMLAKAGCRVPEDIGLAALTVLDCPIDAGIYQNAEEIGRVATLVLISLISDHDCGIPPIPREILVKGKWVDGASLPAR